MKFVFLKFTYCTTLLVKFLLFCNLIGISFSIKTPINKSNTIYHDILGESSSDGTISKGAISFGLGGTGGYTLPQTEQSNVSNILII